LIYDGLYLGSLERHHQLKTWVQTAVNVKKKKEL